MIEICYMCDSTKTSVEHVPPKCIFPEIKDTSNKINYRKNLITVPSCDEHNALKSGDDEYFMMVVTSYFANNKLGSNHVKTKVSRAWNRNPKLAQTVCKNITHIEGTKNYAYEVDLPRLDSIFIHTAHGLYFHQYGMKSDTPFNVMSYPISGNRLVNSASENILKAADQLFLGVKIQGSNSEIFSFQITPKISSKTLIRMNFYQAFTVIMSNSNS